MAPRPDMVEVTPPTRATLMRLIDGMGGAVALNSGRTLGELDQFLAPLTLPAAGTHGIERRDARGVVQPVGDHDPTLAEAHAAMRAFAEEHSLLLEEKRGGSALHCREAPHLEAEVRALVAGLADADENLRAIQGHMVAELSLAGLDKGSALDAFMGEAPFTGRIPVAIGDDTTDEDAFRAAQDRGGIGIRVGPGDTRADARFDDIDALHRWLAACAENDIMQLETP